MCEQGFRLRLPTALGAWILRLVGAGSGTEEPTLPVASVARRLGVAPSTLRTWDRRYGLGPSRRGAPPPPPGGGAPPLGARPPRPPGRPAPPLRQLRHRPARTDAAGVAERRVDGRGRALRPRADAAVRPAPAGGTRRTPGGL